MKEFFGACGLSCSDCEGYKATQTNDQAALSAMADKASKQFGEQISPESLRCDGCMADSDRRCGYCAVCAIRECVVSRGLANCATCDSFECEKASSFLNNVPKARENLNRLRALNA